MKLANSGSQPLNSSGAAVPVAQLAQMLETARVNSDKDFEVTKRLVAEASSLLDLHLGRPPDASTLRRPRAGLARWQINRVSAFIEERLTECIRVCDLSAIARSSPSYFSCAFKRTFGASPHAYLMGRRICRAVELMLKSDAPLSEIAHSCGFADQAHFSRQFRRVMGHPPSHWRRERAAHPDIRRVVSRSSAPNPDP
jgi:AraC family transcriptional regulator